MQIFENKKVLETYSKKKGNLIKIKFNDFTENINTDIHPYYVKNKGWSSYSYLEASSAHNMELKKLKVGDIVYKYSNGSFKEIRIIEIKKLNTLFMVYNLSNIEDNHNFFANGVLVHNKFND